MRRLTAAALLVLGAACADPQEAATVRVEAGPSTTVKSPADPTVADWEALRLSTSTTARASRSRAPSTTVRSRPSAEVLEPAGAARRVSSTAYCLRTPTANGERGYPGSVAMNGVPMGSRWRVNETGIVYRVNDRIGHGSGFDIWKASCAEAVMYGRRSVTVERVG